MASSSSSGESGRVAVVQALFISHLPVIRAVVIAMMPDFDLVDDVVQETFLTVSNKSADFEPGTNFAAWASTIARYKVREALRKRTLRFEPLSEETLDILEAAEPQGEPMEELKRRFEACLVELAPRARHVMEMRYHGAMLPEEIARRIGWTANAVRVALSRARVLLRNCVHRGVAEEGVG